MRLKRRGCPNLKSANMIQAADAAIEIRDGLNAYCARHCGLIRDGLRYALFGVVLS